MGNPTVMHAADVIEYNIHVFGCLVAAYFTVVHNDLIFSSTEDSFAFSGSTLLVGRLEDHLAGKKTE